ncbi:MAG: ABC transporter ATP-binding protein [Eubacteriales bacterium]|nr:ABC transporter ATP-binding protein [Eubacteriales bacterium]
MSIVIKNITKSFGRNDEPGKFAILKDISLEIPSREFISFVGPSGCGKSTLMRIMAGLLEPESGSVEIDGETVTGPGSDRMMVFQDYVLFPWMTVWKNIALGLKMAGKPKDYITKKVEWVIRLVGLEDFRNSYPDQLSGGMKQRVAIARALVMNPKILLMDEPFGALDSFTKMKLQDELMHLCDKKEFTTCLVTHDSEEAVFLSDRIVVFTGSPARIKEIICVDLPRPRNRTSPEFIAVRNRILELNAENRED